MIQTNKTKKKKIARDKTCRLVAKRINICINNRYIMCIVSYTVHGTLKMVMIWV